MDKCSKCGATIENNKCTYCGTIFDQQPSYNGSMQEQPQYQNIHKPQVTNIYVNQMPNATPLMNNMNSVSPKSKGTTLLLAIFLGFFGIHQFYVGKVGMGIFYILTFGFFFIGWFIDILVIISGNFKDSNGLKIK